MYGGQMRSCYLHVIHRMSHSMIEPKLLAGRHILAILFCAKPAASYRHLMALYTSAPRTYPLEMHAEVWQ